MALAPANDGSSTTGLTTSAGAGMASSSGKLISANTATPVAASIGAAVGGASAGCGIFGRLAGFSTASDMRLYAGLQVQGNYGSNHYYARVFFTANHLRDYVEIHEIIAGIDTLLTPQANAFSDTTLKRIYFKRGKLTTSDRIGWKWLDNEMQLWHIMPDGKGFYLGKAVDGSITTPGYCGIYLGTDPAAAWDDIYTGTVDIKWVSSSGNDTTGTGTKANPYREIAQGLRNTPAGGLTFIRAGSNYKPVEHGGTYYSPNFTLSMPLGTSWYNPQCVFAYNAEVAVITPGATSGNGVRFGYVQGDMTNAYHYWNDISNDGQNIHGGTGWVALARASKIRIQGGKHWRHGISTFSAIAIQTTVHNDALAGQLDDYDFYSIDCEVSDQGYSHGFYLYRPGDNVIFCRIHDNNYIGIQMQPTPNGTTIRDSFDNILSHNKIWGHTARPQSCGIYVAHTNNCKVFCNEIFNNKDGIQINGNNSAAYYNGAQNTKILNNLIYNNTQYGILHGQHTGGGTSGGMYAKGTLIQNNALVGNALGSISWTFLGPQDNGSNGSGNFENHNITTNPGWVDPTNANPLLKNFALSTGSGIAYNTGADTTSIVKTDHEGFPTAGGIMEIGSRLWIESIPDDTLNPVLSGPISLEVLEGIDKFLNQFLAGDDNPVEVGNYSLRITVKNGTLNDGV